MERAIELTPESASGSAGSHAGKSELGDQKTNVPKMKPWERKLQDNLRAMSLEETALVFSVSLGNNVSSELFPIGLC